MKFAVMVLVHFIKIKIIVFHIISVNLYINVVHSTDYILKSYHHIQETAFRQKT